MPSMRDQKSVSTRVDSTVHRRESVTPPEGPRAYRTSGLGSFRPGYPGCAGPTGEGPAPSHAGSLVRRAHRFLRIPACLLLLWAPVLAQASLGTWVKGVLHLGIYRERVATLQATLSADHGTWGLAFSPHGRYLAASSPQTAFVQLWDWRKDRVVRRFRRSGSDIMTTTPLAFSPQGRLLASCQSDAYTIIQVWNARTGAVVDNIPSPPSGGGCLALAFSPQGHSLIWIRNWLGNPPPNLHMLLVYSTRTWTERWGLATRPFEPNALAVSAHGHWAALGGGTSNSTLVGFQQQIALVNLRRHTLVRLIGTFPMSQWWGPGKPRLGPSYPPMALAWNSRNQSVAMGVWSAGMGAANVIRVYHAHTGTLAASESGPTGTKVNALCYPPQGRYLIEAGIHQMVEIRDGSHHHLLQKIPHQAWSLAVSPHGHYLALGEGRQIQIWRLR